MQAELDLIPVKLIFKDLEKFQKFFTDTCDLKQTVSTYLLHVHGFLFAESIKEICVIPIHLIFMRFED